MFLSCYGAIVADVCSWWQGEYEHDTAFIERLFGFISLNYFFTSHSLESYSKNSLVKLVLTIFFWFAVSVVCVHSEV